MAETVELTTLIDELTSNYTLLKTRVTETTERLDKLGLAVEKHGLDLDGEAKFNLKSLADSVADQEVLVSKLRRARAMGPDPGPNADGIAPLVDPRSGKAVEFGRRAWKSRAVYTVLGSQEYADAYDAALRMKMRIDDLGDSDKGILRGQRVPERLEKMLPKEATSRMDYKAVGLSTDFEPAGGIFCPATMESEITRRALEISPFEQYARVVVIGSNRYEGAIRTANRDTITMTGERATPTQDTELKRYQMRAIDAQQWTVYPALTQQMVEDSEQDLGAELVADTAVDFAKLRGQHFISGSGSGEPEGLFTSSEVKQKASGLALTFDMESIKRLPQELATIYKGPRARYLLSRTALTEAMLWREDTGGVGTGAFLWEPSTQAGTPSRLNGYEWSEMVDMDAVGANAYPVGFGDIYTAYRIVERRGIRTIIDNLTQDPFIVYRMSRRYGGRVWLGEAFVKLKCAVSL